MMGIFEKFVFVVGLCVAVGIIEDPEGEWRGRLLKIGFIPPLIIILIINRVFDQPWVIGLIENYAFGLFFGGVIGLLLRNFGITPG